MDKNVVVVKDISASSTQQPIYRSSEKAKFVKIRKSTPSVKSFRTSTISMSIATPTTKTAAKTSTTRKPILKATASFPNKVVQPKNPLTKKYQIKSSIVNPTINSNNSSMKGTMIQTNSNDSKLSVMVHVNSTNQLKGVRKVRKYIRRKKKPLTMIKTKTEILTITIAPTSTTMISQATTSFVLNSSNKETIDKTKMKGIYLTSPTAQTIPKPTSKNWLKKHPLHPDLVGHLVTPSDTNNNMGRLIDFDAINASVISKPKVQAMIDQNILKQLLSETSPLPLMEKNSNVNTSKLPQTYKRIVEEQSRRPEMTYQHANRTRDLVLSDSNHELTSLTQSTPFPVIKLDTSLIDRNISSYSRIESDCVKKSSGSEYLNDMKLDMSEEEKKLVIQSGEDRIKDRQANMVVLIDNARSAMDRQLSRLARIANDISREERMRARTNSRLSPNIGLERMHGVRYLLDY